MCVFVYILSDNKNCGALLFQLLYSHIVSDIKRINAKHKNNRVNTVGVITLLTTLLSTRLIVAGTLPIIVTLITV